MSLDDFLRAASLPAWLFCIACLLPAVWRLVRRRSRYLDPIWLVVLLLAINRISFLMRVSPEMSHATALLLAMAMGMLALSFQRYDREGRP